VVEDGYASVLIFFKEPNSLLPLWEKVAEGRMRGVDYEKII